MTSAITGAVVSVVVVLSLVVDSPSSLLLLQEMIVRLKRNMEEMMSICLTWFPISGLGEPYIYHDLGVFYKNRGFYLDGSEYGFKYLRTDKQTVNVDGLF